MFWFKVNKKEMVGICLFVDVVIWSVLVGWVNLGIVVVYSYLINVCDFIMFIIFVKVWREFWWFG